MILNLKCIQSSKNYNNPYKNVILLEKLIFRTKALKKEKILKKILMKSKRKMVEKSLKMTTDLEH